MTEEYSMRLCLKMLTLITLLSISLPVVRAQSRARRQVRPVTTAAPAQGASQGLPLHRVILYSNGVAYFERRGQVTGHAEINLPFKQSQIDDVLKSMVVLDLGKGRIGAVSYNSSAPPSARLADIPFSIGASTPDDEEGGLAAVLRQLQGARVLVTTANRSVTGSVLTVDEKKSQIDANKPPLVSRSVVISSDTGEMASLDLADVRSLKLLDEGSRRDVNEFANASAAARRRDAKTITVTSDGEGSRELVVSYTIASPIWKTSYRLVLDSTGKPFFQGWAIIDNVGEEDWSNIKLSLVSGTPVSFIQPIQQPMYRYRPVVPIPADLKLDPQNYEIEEGEGGHSPPALLSMESSVLGGTPGGVPGGISSKQIESLPLNGRNIQNFANLSPGAVSANITENAIAPEPVRSLSDLVAGENSGVETAASGNEVGDLFEYNIDQPVTVRRDRSALIPIVQTKLEGARVSLYNESVRRDRPMSGLRLKNVSNLTLEGGPLTVIDGDAYAGEALMERLKPGEERFVGFALDLGTLVSTKAKTDREPAFFARVVNGVFQAHFHQTEKKTYTLINQTDRPRLVYVEHPLRQGWVLSDDTPKPASKTSSFYRFRVELEPRKTVELNVVERLAVMDSYALYTITPREIELFVSKRYIDDRTRAALDNIIEIKSRIASSATRIGAANKETEEIGEDQERLRKNIEALKDTPETKQLLARYVAKAGQQETRLEQILADKKASAAELSQLQKELDAAVRAMAVDRKLALE
jgi:hypothetical protein